MSIIKWFNKPKWQNPNKKVRLAAVTHGQEPELIKALTEIARNDESTAVQKAALGRLTDYDTILEIANESQNKDLKAFAHKKINDWIANIDDHTKQLSIVNKISDAQNREYLAQHAKSSEIRAHLISDIQKQGLLGDLIICEKSTSLQKKLLEKITQISTLKRISKHFKRQNKTLYKSIQEKLSTLDQQKTTNEDQTALELCQQLEDLIHKKTNSLDIDKIQTQWKQIQSNVSPTLIQRYAGAYRTAQLTLNPAKREEFLYHQKKQRAQNQLIQIRQKLTKNTEYELNDIQRLIDEIQKIDLNLIEQTEQSEHKKLIQELTRIRDKTIQQQQVPESITNIYEQLEKTLNQDSAQPGQLKFFKKQWNTEYQKAQTSVALKQLSKQFEQNIQKLAEKTEQSSQLKEQSAQQAIDMISEAKKAIKDGHLNDAKRIINQIATHKNKAGHAHPKIKKHKFAFDQVWNELKELRKWQKWSNDKIREDIINELKSLIGTGLHPDAVLKKLQDCNQRWYQLEDMEKLEGDKYPTRNQALWLKFREVSENLFKPAQPYYEKRSEIQNQKIQEYETLIEELHKCDLENTSEKDLARQSRTAIKYLKELNNLPPKSRGKMAKKIRSGIDRIDQKLEEFYSVAERRKLKLIDGALQLVDEADLEKALNEAKKLQAEWKNAGIVRPYTERKLWKKFRKANDAIFKRRDADKKQQDQAHKERLAQGENLLQQTQQQLNQIKQPQELQSLMEKTQQQWKELNIHHKALGGRFNTLFDDIEKQLENFEKQKITTEIKNYQQLDQICIDLSIENITSEQALESMQNMKSHIPEKHLKHFHKRIESSENNGEKVIPTLRELLIAAEYLTGTETPAEDNEFRMNYQVKRLSNRMAGENHYSQEEEAKNLIVNWYLAAKETEFLQQYKKRIDRNLKALKKIVT